jgi:hypothetical protein
MACFLVPAAEAVVATIIEHRAAKSTKPESADTGRVPWKTKLHWLTNLLWGGSILLALEHLWHGEISLKPPFLTALETSEGTVTMLEELATVGLGMALMVTLAWVAMIVVADRVPVVRQALTRQA